MYDIQFLLTNNYASLCAFVHAQSAPLPCMVVLRHRLAKEGNRIQSSRLYTCFPKSGPNFLISVQLPHARNVYMLCWKAGEIPNCELKTLSPYSPGLPYSRMVRIKSFNIDNCFNAKRLIRWQFLISHYIHGRATSVKYIAGAGAAACRLIDEVNSSTRTMKAELVNQQRSKIYRPHGMDANCRAIHRDYILYL